MKQKIQLFIFMSIPFGVIMGILNGHDLNSTATYGLFLGISFGTLMTIILSIIQRINLKKLGISERKVKVVNTAFIKINANIEKVFELCHKSLESIKKCEIKESDIEKGTIKASAGMSWYSWGDTILFNIERDEKESFSIKIISRPTMRTVMIDYGKNLDNINRIIDYIRYSNKNVKVTLNGCNIT